MQANNVNNPVSTRFAKLLQGNPIGSIETTYPHVETERQITGKSHHERTRKILRLKTYEITMYAVSTINHNGSVNTMAEKDSRKKIIRHADGEP